MLRRSLRRTSSTPHSAFRIPPGIWTFLSSLGENEYFSILVDKIPTPRILLARPVSGQEIPMEMSRYFEELTEGEEFRSPTRTIAESDLYIFGGLTWDLTEFHYSTEAAKQTVFGQRVAHGMLIVSIANGLYNRIGVTDTTGLALMGVEWRFLAPAFIGDTIQLVARVERKRETHAPDRGLVHWAARVVNQRGETLCEGRMIRLVKRRPPEAEGAAHGA
jgi:acyl dehydratase